MYDRFVVQEVGFKMALVSCSLVIYWESFGVTCYCCLQDRFQYFIKLHVQTEKLEMLISWVIWRRCWNGRFYIAWRLSLIVKKERWLEVKYLWPIYYSIPEFYSMGKTMSISVQIGRFRRKIRMASTYRINAFGTWLWLYCNFLEIYVTPIAASLTVEPYNISNESERSKKCWNFLESRVRGNLYSDTN